MFNNKIRNNVLLFSLEFPPFIGGVSTYNYELVIGLAELGFNIDVLTRDYQLIKDEQEQVDLELGCRFGIRIIRNKDIHGLGLIGWYIALVKYLSLRQYDYSCILITDIGGQRVASLIDFKLLSLNYYITVHGSEVYTTFIKEFSSRGMMKLFFPIFKRLSNSLYSNAKGVVFVSRYTKDLFLKYFKGKLHSFAVIHNGICPSRILDHDSLLTKLACKKNKLNLITISRLDPRKNHEIVIEAIDSLPINIKNRLSYRIAGVGQSMEFLVSLVNAKNLKDIITFEGRISERRKWDLLDSSDVYVMPSKELKGTVEGLGISFLEAAARGLPLIGGNHGGIPEIVINGVNGYLVKSDNSEHVANAIRSFVNDRELVNYMSINSRRIVKNFTRHNMAAKTVKFICPKDRISSNQD